MPKLEKMLGEKRDTMSRDNLIDSLSHVPIGAAVENPEAVLLAVCYDRAVSD